MRIPLLLSVALGLGASALPTAIDTRKLKPEASTRHLAERDDWSVTRNDLINGPCLPVTIIFARGTLELGNVGALAGPPFFNALGDMIGQQNLAVQGVDYGATIAGYLEGGDPAGAATMASLTSFAVGQCPDTKIVLSGYRYIGPPNQKLLANFSTVKEPKSSTSASSRSHRPWHHMSQQSSSSGIQMMAKRSKALRPT